MREAITYEHRVKGWPLAALLGGTAVAIVAGVIASDGTVPGWEQAIFHGINGLPDWLRAPMWVFQLAGLLLVPLVVAIGALAFRRYRLAIALLAFIPLKLIVEKGVVKNLVERRRPGTTICHLDYHADTSAMCPSSRFRSSRATRSSRGESRRCSTRTCPGDGDGCLS